MQCNVCIGNVHVNVYLTQNNILKLSIDRFMKMHYEHSLCKDIKTRYVTLFSENSYLEAEVIYMYTHPCVPRIQINACKLLRYC